MKIYKLSHDHHILITLRVGGQSITFGSHRSVNYPIMDGHHHYNNWNFEHRDFSEIKETVYIKNCKYIHGKIEDIIDNKGDFNFRHKNWLFTSLRGRLLANISRKNLSGNYVGIISENQNNINFIIGDYITPISLNEWVEIKNNVCSVSEMISKRFNIKIHTGLRIRPKQYSTK